jgi:hypothetical protein
MPDGVVQWIDQASGEAAVVRGGHVYATASTDMEPAARHPGAHVHFDIRRHDGGERAVEVKLHPTSRASHHRHRYGTLAGARHPDTKGTAPFARAHPELPGALASHPLEVARLWVDCLQDRDLDRALALYASDAVLHTEDGDRIGRSHLGSWLEASPMLGTQRDPDIRGEDGLAVVSWASGLDGGIELRARIAHGLIQEQWVGEVPAEGRSVEVEGATGPISVAVLTRGLVAEGEVAYAVERVEAVLDRIEAPVLFARLKLGRTGDPARPRPAMAQVALDIDGELVRAHVAGATMREAVDALQRRLLDKLEQRAQHRHDLRTRTGRPSPGEWRHGDLPTERADHFDRPPDEREVVRHKAFALDELTVDEAAFDMAQLDYDFHLFRDLASGQDALLERTGDGTLRLTRLEPTDVEAGPTAVDLTVADTHPPTLTVAEATDRLDAGGERFVFFANAATGRGNVLYLRYDGHYGLLTPA